MILDKTINKYQAQHMGFYRYNAFSFYAISFSETDSWVWLFSSTSCLQGWSWLRLSWLGSWLSNYTIPNACTPQTHKIYKLCTCNWNWASSGIYTPICLMSSLRTFSAQALYISTHLHKAVPTLQALTLESLQAML